MSKTEKPTPCPRTDLVEAKEQLRFLLKDFGERGENNKDKVLRC